jgi:hypothetical protein
VDSISSIAEKMHSSTLVAAALAVALAMLVYGIGLLGRQILRGRFLRETTGKLVGWKKEYDAQISFHAEDGSEHQLVMTVLASAKPKMGVGQPFPMPVVYDVRHPEHASIGRIAYFWIVPFVWMLIGSGTLMFATNSLPTSIRSWIGSIDFPEALGAVGVIMSAIGIGTLYRRIVFFFRSQQTVGKLVAWKEERKFDPRGRLTTFYTAVVSFQGSDGSAHRVESDWGFGKKSTMPMGHPFPVRYNPTDPQDAHIATVANLWATPVLYLLIGGFILSLVF